MTITSDLAHRRLRDIFGTFASGLTVITSSTPDGAAGFTCQSFASLSLDPALVTFSPARSSTARRDGQPLVFFRGRYAALSPADLLLEAAG